jgi:hypothetical protein
LCRIPQQAVTRGLPQHRGDGDLAFVNNGESGFDGWLAAFPDDLEDYHVPGIRILRPRFYGQATVEAIAIGLPLGLIDVHSKQGDWFDAHLAFLLAGLSPGLRHAGRAWQAWGPLGFCYYLIHRLAIAYGYRPPYVEEDARSALLSFVIRHL